ncbi:MAG: hypothetical protein WCD86_02460 [Ktedonobacteraceae bacterium]
MPKRVLRSFLYLDENIVDDYLAQFEGGIVEGLYTSKDTTTGVKGGGGGIKIGIATGNANISSTSTTETSQTIRETFAARFTRLYDHLAHDELIQPLNGFDLTIYEQIGLGEIIEIRGEAKLPQWEHLSRTISGITNFVDIMEAIGLNPLADNEVNEAYQGFTTLIAKKVQEGVQLIISPVGSPRFKFVANLHRSKITRPLEELDSEVTVLGKVQRKLAERETIDIFRIAPRLDQLGELNRIQRRGMNKGRAKIPSTDTPLDQVIKYPAMQILPIAIYQ